jgi:hypothetical protein
MRRLQVNANAVPSSPILTRATWRNIPEDSILHSHRCENLKSYLKQFLQQFKLDAKKSFHHGTSGKCILLCHLHQASRMIKLKQTTLTILSHALITLTKVSLQLILPLVILSSPY